MKRSLILLSACLGLTAGAASACPWAGGAYSFKESGIYGEFTVTADCSQMTWKRLSDPETVPLERTKHGWLGKLKKVDAELLDNGHSIRLYDSGLMRQTKVEPKS